MSFFRLIGFLFVLFVMPPLGYLTAATVFTHFGDQIEVRDTRGAHLVAVAKSCTAQEPITLTGGFKTWYTCEAEVSANGGPSRTQEARGFLNPDLIGVPVEVGTTNKGSRLVAKHPLHPTAAPLLLAATVIGWILAMGAMLWVLSRKHMRKPRVDSPPEEQPDEAYIRGRKKWLRGSWIFGALVLCVLGTIVYSGDAFAGDTTRTTLAVASWSLPVLLFLNALRKLFFWPAVTISPTGVDWTTDKPTWAEIERVDLSARHVLTVQRVGGMPQKVGRFGPEQADEIHRAMRKYGKSTVYQREAAVASSA
ncbi:hypothetical protein BBK82_46075 [Lentzea guizhouensis]|uniref:Uncharacterized protein n=1 Tax=Lentzea guizhouensis TaxID=1586287 RepID=A0A1B2HWW5_9PSEU|nr:DUF6346 domain-containing protein [Lentzea guizhouensis]ANZ42214.1 hypothetical protein BBK82_46075 [Lentzea guizhouensis]